MVYELIIQIGLWFIVTFLALLFFKNNLILYPNILQLILWVSSGIYFIYSWANGGQTLAMRAWGLKLVFPKNSYWFYLARYLLATIGIVLLLISFFWVLFNKKNQNLHDCILGSRIINVRF